MKSKYYYEYTRNMKDETAKDLDRINKKLFNENAKKRNRRG